MLTFCFSNSFSIPKILLLITENSNLSEFLKDKAEVSIIKFITVAEVKWEVQKDRSDSEPISIMCCVGEVNWNWELDGEKKSKLHTLDMDSFILAIVYSMCSYVIAICKIGRIEKTREKCELWSR